MPDRPRSEHRQRQVMLALRVNPEEERRIREAAKAQRVSVASLIRKAVLAAAEQPAETEWGIRYPAGLPGERVRNFGSEDGGHMARLLLPDVLKAYGDGTALVCRGIGPWLPADDPATREQDNG